MKYGTTEFYIEKGSVSFTKKLNKKIMHYPGTNKSIEHNLGREATVITCRIITLSDTERISIEQLLHSETSTTLEYHNFFYKDVVPGMTNKPEPISESKEVWAIDAEFIALDPVPYDIVTEEALY